MNTKLAQSIIGKVDPPPGISKYGGELAGFALFLNNILKFATVAASIYALVNLIFAGYAFMSAGDDAQKIAGAWAKIWQTLLGLAIAAGSFVLAAIFGKLIFGDYNALIQLKVFGP